MVKFVFMESSFSLMVPKPKNVDFVANQLCQRQAIKHPFGGKVNTKEKGFERESNHTHKFLTE